MKGPDFLVRVNCTTFNHSKYIREALDSFCMQETSFPFVCTIIDDASTDGEQEILKSYLQEHFDMDNKEVVREEEYDTHTLIYAQHQENKNCFFAVILLKYNHYSIKKPKHPYAEEWKTSTYCASCEGDDFWTSPHKLQRQVNYMESHPNHSLCFHANYSLNSNGEKRKHIPYKKDVEVLPMSDIILGGGSLMATNSMLYLQQLYLKKADWAKGCPVGDTPTMLTLAEKGKVGYINEIMSCYRVAAEGSWTQRVLYDKKQSKEHYKKTQLVWKKFDEWTNYKYHKIVKRKILKNKITYWGKRSSFLKSLLRTYKKHIKPLK